MIFKKIKAIFELFRPLEWSKSFGNMIMAALIALAVLGNLNGITLEMIIRFLIGFIAVGPLLWGGSYALNDWTDHEKDKLHPVKKNRSIPSGRVSANEALVLSISAISLALIIGFMLNQMFLLCVIIMLINQLLYTVPPIKLKEKPILDLVSGSLINPIFRFYSGWVLFIPAFNAPILFLIFILGIQFGGYTLYRLSGKKVEKKLNYKSSVVVFGANKIKLISYLAILLSCASYTLLTLFPSFFPSLKFLGFLRIEFLYFGLIMLLPLPIYLKILKNPEAKDIKKMYRILYFHFILFTIGFIGMFFLFPIK